MTYSYVQAEDDVYNQLHVPTWSRRVSGHNSQSHPQTQSKDKKTNIFLDSSSKEIEKDEVVDPDILVSSTRNKEPLNCRTASTIKDEGPRLSRMLQGQCSH